MTAPPGPSRDDDASLARRAAGPLLVVLVALVMIAWTWRVCPDPAVDFFRELYVAWRLAGGQMLYRDVNYFDGPLGPYVAATALEVLGVSIDALKLLNAAFIVLVALLVYAVLRDL